MKAPLGRVIVLYKSPDMASENEFGFYELSEEARRNMMRGKTRIIRSDDPPPDIIRNGVVVASSSREVGTGWTVLFNKHDGDAFELGRCTYYSIPTEFIKARVL